MSSKKLKKFERKTEPITFEILRHRMQSAVEEAAVTLKNVSGSPVATEIGDMNLAIMDREGTCIAVGQYTICKGTSLSYVVKDVLEHYKENPGIFDGDAFICNDPYVGVMHQNDVAVVAPYYRDGELLAWVGAEVHQIDVGGPVPGQVQLGAKSIYGEAPTMPPMKLMKDNVILADVERNYISKSRVPDMVALDLRAKIAACNSLKLNVSNVAEQLGNTGIIDFFNDMLNDAERLMKQKLLKIPNGCWHSRGFLEFDEKIFPVVVNLTKKDDSMIFDFAGTAQQAPATINMTKNAIDGWMSAAVVGAMCWDIPWTVGGVMRTYEIVSEPGTLVNPTFPAGVSKSTTSLGLLLTSVLDRAMSKMLLTCPEFADHAMSSWPGSKSQEELHGINQYGEVFGADILDGMAGGGGARIYKDGVDTGGLEGAPRVSISNVEEYEQQYPFLYLYRREYPDSGGVGMFRGGNGLDRMYAVHDVDRIDTIIMHSIGSKIPATAGLGGGHPSATNLFMIKRDTSIEDSFRKGILPVNFDQLDGKTEYHAAMSESSLSKSDIYRTVCNGGGGYGDPLLRDYTLIQEDCRCGRITKEAAKKFYGTIITNDSSVDKDASDMLRSKMRIERLSKSIRPQKELSEIKMTEEKYSINVSMKCGIASDGKAHIFCSCGQDLGLASENYIDNLAYADSEFRTSGEHVDPLNLSNGEYFIRYTYCPHCGLELQNEILIKGLEPLEADTVELI